VLAQSPRRHRSPVVERSPTGRGNSWAVREPSPFSYSLPIWERASPSRRLGAAASV
jgi:hypothetical protein